MPEAWFQQEVQPPDLLQLDIEYLPRSDSFAERMVWKSGDFEKRIEQTVEGRWEARKMFYERGESKLFHRSRGYLFNGEHTGEFQR